MSITLGGMLAAMHEDGLGCTGAYCVPRAAEWGAVMAKLCQNERFLNGRSNGSGRKFARPPVRHVTCLTGGLNGFSRDSNPLWVVLPAATTVVARRWRRERVDSPYLLSTSVTRAWGTSPDCNAPSSLPSLLLVDRSLSTGCWTLPPPPPRPRLRLHLLRRLPLPSSRGTVRRSPGHWRLPPATLERACALSAPLFDAGAQ